MKKEPARRNFLQRMLAGMAGIAAMPLSTVARNTSDMHAAPIIKSVKPLGFQWETLDPFLFCVHHEDAFPAGNAQMGPDANYFKGRHMGDDFIIKDGFRMYHGKTVPGFPGHPHRGFETVTVVRKGMVDHADSMGASGRYGDGDVQWMTAGGGVQHSEMFPLIHADRANPMELFQIWLNLPARKKMVKPHFKMLWRESIPMYAHTDAAGRKTRVEVIAGTLGSQKAPAPPPDSWAADAAHGVAIWNILMQPGAVWELPAAAAGLNRMLYYYEGEGLQADGQTIPKYHALELDASRALKLVAGLSGGETSLLLLQGKPIGEPVIQYGPFVMNTKAEINQAFEDYHKTQFGGWPWPKYDQVHARSQRRFAKHSDGRVEDKG